MSDRLEDAAPNPWRDTVRDIFDMVVTAASPATLVEQKIVELIETRHHDYFCDGKTIAEWEQERGEQKQ